MHGCSFFLRGGRGGPRNNFICLNFQGRSGPSNPISRSMHENCLRDTFLIILHIIYIHRSKLLPLQCNLHITTWQQAPSPILSLPTSSNIVQSEIMTLNQSVNNLHSHLLLLILWRFLYCT